MRFGELFAGIGGFSLGLERAGMKCAWQVEIDPYARAVLNKHWPEVPKHDDVRTFPPQGDYGVDLICGGFPCQDISSAGTKRGLQGERSGLWAEYARIIGELRPRYVIVENVAAILARGMGAVLGDLSTLGYDAEWHCIPAAHAGAPIQAEGRDRVWIVAQSDGGRQRWSRIPRQAARESLARTAGGHCAFRGIPNATSNHWASEPDVGRVAHGIPSRVDRLRCLGNAVVPQVVEVIGRAILAAEARMTA